MRFFEDIRGTIYPVARIDHMRRSFGSRVSDKRAPAKVYLIGDDAAGVEVLDQEIEQIQKGGGTIIPANPGFTLVAHYTDGEGDPDTWTDRSPIIAWRLGEEGSVKPVTIDWNYNDADMSDRLAILRPDGVVRSDAMDADFKDIATWEAEIRAVRELAKKPEPNAPPP